MRLSFILAFLLSLGACVNPAEEPVAETPEEFGKRLVDILKAGPPADTALWPSFKMISDPGLSGTSPATRESFQKDEEELQSKVGENSEKLKKAIWDLTRNSPMIQPNWDQITFERLDYEIENMPNIRRLHGLLVVVADGEEYGIKFRNAVLIDLKWYAPEVQSAYNLKNGEAASNATAPFIYSLF